MANARCAESPSSLARDSRLSNAIPSFMRRRPAGSTHRAGPSGPRARTTRESSRWACRGSCRAGRSPATGHSVPRGGGWPPRDAPARTRSSWPPRRAGRRRRRDGAGHSWPCPWRGRGGTLLNSHRRARRDGSGTPCTENRIPVRPAVARLFTGRLRVRDAGTEPGPVPVGREQHGAEHRTVVRVKLAAQVRDELVGCPLRMLRAPGRHGSACPVQVLGLVLAEPHRAPLRARPGLAAEHGRAAHAAVSRRHAGHPDAAPTRWSRPRVQVIDGGGSSIRNPGTSRSRLSAPASSPARSRQVPGYRHRGVVSLDPLPQPLGPRIGEGGALAVLARGRAHAVVSGDVIRLAPVVPQLVQLPGGGHAVRRRPGANRWPPDARASRTRRKMTGSLTQPAPFAPGARCAPWYSRCALARAAPAAGRAGRPPAA